MSFFSQVQRDRAIAPIYLTSVASPPTSSVARSPSQRLPGIAQRYPGAWSQVVDRTQRFRIMPSAFPGSRGWWYGIVTNATPSKVVAMQIKMGEMAGVTGLEPAASGVTGRRSNQLSYTPQDGAAPDRLGSGSDDLKHPLGGVKRCREQAQIKTD